MLRKWIGLGIVGAAALAGTAFADNQKNRENDAAAIASAGISLGAAVTTAEQHVPGKAARAEYERQKDGRWVYDVEVAGPSGVFDVKIDADKGTVLAATAAKADADDDDEKAD
jgi:uncharacterized membrane protein YkoI